MGLKQIDLDSDNPDPLRQPGGEDRRRADTSAFPTSCLRQSSGRTPNSGAWRTEARSSRQRIHTAEDGSTLDLGEFHVENGLTLAGRVVCSDGKDVPSGPRFMRRCPQTLASVS